MKKSIEIEISGKKLFFPFGVGFLSSCLESLNLDIQSIGEKIQSNPFKYVPDLMYESLKYASFRKEVEIELSYNELIDLIDEDEDGLEVINKFAIAFVQSLSKNVPVQKGVRQVKGAKKK